MKNLTPKTEKKLYKLATKVLPNLVNQLMYDSDGYYTLFEEYVINKENDAYTVRRYRDESTLIFGNLRHAAAWCILDKHNKLNESRRLLELDARLTSVAADKKNHIRLTFKGDNKEINNDKYLQDEAKEHGFKYEIDKYITMAKHCQQRGFKNEFK